jgi:hypothetical protein
MDRVPGTVASLGTTVVPDKVFLQFLLYWKLADAPAGRGSVLG